MSAPAYVRALELKLNTIHRDIQAIASALTKYSSDKPKTKINKPQPKIGLNGKPLVAKVKKPAIKNQSSLVAKPKTLPKAKGPTPDILDYTLKNVNTERSLALKGLKAKDLDVKFWYAYKEGQTFISVDGIEYCPKEGVIKVYDEAEMKELKKRPGNPFQLHKDSIAVDYQSPDGNSLSLRFRVPQQAVSFVGVDTDRLLEQAENGVGFTRHPEGDRFELNKGWKNSN